MSHHLRKDKRGLWRILKDAGLYIIVAMGLVLIALAIGCGIGARMIG